CLVGGNEYRRTRLEPGALFYVDRTLDGAGDGNDRGLLVANVITVRSRVDQPRVGVVDLCCDGLSRGDDAGVQLHLVVGGRDVGRISAQRQAGLLPGVIT